MSNNKFFFGMLKQQVNAPVIFVEPTGLDLGNGNVGGPYSEPQILTVNAENLTETVVITLFHPVAPDSYIIIPTSIEPELDGTITNIEVSVQSTPQQDGTNNANLLFSSAGAITVNIPLVATGEGAGGGG